MKRPAAWRYAAAEDQAARDRVASLLDDALTAAAAIPYEFDAALDIPYAELDDDGLEVVIAIEAYAEAVVAHRNARPFGSDTP